MVTRVTTWRPPGISSTYFGYGIFPEARYFSDGILVVSRFFVLLGIRVGTPRDFLEHLLGRILVSVSGAHPCVARAAPRDLATVSGSFSATVSRTRSSPQVPR